mmetsp:Transcript_21027/g.35479  ORF Transcript_21027/g.35479 Transcript_21027/m.35479 type:complete len:413 (+) Transcript_21027:205-1443(+)|eukprot:CAMPEP_0114423066 /NCGR_PEP_ID=MMETSP0103-20121206/5947_1 /TAXON_ID=37642 ORGANISM="Paraphysomonas imperforata, Strain PA2" /NCGR_SAMPLE_ID=MMETSP0103 /ASSEMBLY_ACC=CAM_ASM_000201 /LENGTH=412 /DNA_ID=CAMNT_0001591697 /DNA_START=159 /DNA_END=1400 /DNA_ORIENTATION=+
MFSQLIGDPSDTSNEGNIYSALEFDCKGDYLASGDRGGRVVIYERNQHAPRKASVMDLDNADDPWTIHHQFQSHDQEFDYLKSLEIEEKINHIQWCKSVGDNQFLFTTNDKTVKLWKIGPRALRFDNKKRSVIRDGILSIEHEHRAEITTTASPKRVYANAHAYHINSISSNSDGETFLSADDLRINWWNKEISSSSFNIVDIKPPNMEELTEVITSAQFHPSHCNIVMYSSSRGAIKLGDTRKASLCDTSCKVFEEPEDSGAKSFFSEIVASISDASFTKDGRYIISRDYLTLKIWDINMENQPVKVININDNLKSMLSELYESDCIFDKFEASSNAAGDRVVTGCYGNQFSVWNRNGRNEKCIQLNGTGNGDMRPQQNVDFDKKVLHCAWNPADNTVALAAQAALYLYEV